MIEHRDEWFTAPWWEDRIGLAICTDNPVVCNLRITMAHFELSLALRSLLGSDTGANFHTWATWGSKKAGSTIRQEDIPGLRRAALLAGSILGMAAGRYLARIAPANGHRPSLATPGAILGGLWCFAIAGNMLGISTRRILQGNITVLDDIGRATARFICTFCEHRDPDEGRLSEYLSTLRTGPTQEGGQDLLKDAFTNYYRAWHEPNPDAKHEFMLLANLSAILHEHIRLQPFIAGSMPRPLRRLVTSRLLHYRIGLDQLDVHQDVPAWEMPGFPTLLRTIENPNLRRFLNGPGGWDRTPGSYLGSRAQDWSNINDRMNYICDLFRSRQFDPGLYIQPYADEQCECIWDGRVPSRPL